MGRDLSLSKSVKLCAGFIYHQTMLQMAFVLGSLLANSQRGQSQKSSSLAMPHLLDLISKKKPLEEDGRVGKEWMHLIPSTLSQ